MATEVIMPKAGMAMESGTVIQWFKQPGEYVEAGEPLLEIETDKVAMEVEAEISGYLLATLYGEGDEVPVITTIGYLGEKGEEPPQSASSATETGETEGSGTAAATDASPTGTVPSGRGDDRTSISRNENGTIPATPAARRRAEEMGVDLAAASPSGQWGEVRLRDVEEIQDGSASTSGADVRVSSVARKIAADSGVDLSSISGSGPGGRIVKQDVLDRLESGSTATAAGSTRKPLKGMRKVIAQRMSYSHQTVPPVTLNRKVTMDAFLDLRAQLNRSGGAEGERTGTERVSVTDLLVKAVARALLDAPYMRASIDGDELVTTDRTDIGIAVALEEGLLVPVLRDVAARPLSAIVADRNDLVTRARNRALAPDELQGATFTITNLGMYGITSFTPIVNTPESGILGVNAVEDRLFLDAAGEVRSKKEMTLSLTIDHRIVDGAQGAIFLDTLAKLIENPVQILV